MANVFLLLWALVSIGATLAGRTEQGALPGSEGIANTFLRMTAPLQSIETLDMDYVVLAGSILLAAAYAVTWLYSLFSGSVRNAPRYATMRENFRQLSREIEKVRLDALQEHELRVKAFVDRVHSVMSAELADWVRLQDLDRGNDPDGEVASIRA
jgi:hypothetical protein